ncbi:sugar phosphate nucleotidyltransferase, partial [Citrobacter portucalensis]|uniref:sugar phosphate nucleotidyltransferase n=1 Tax=Citrobacter portucalensis TaxID=1639133 RepID=UPI00226B03FE
MKNNTTILPVIMAGGIGSRLWPLSRNSYPKQFLTLFGENTMLQETVHRLNGLECEAPLVICNNIHRFIAAEQLMEIGIQKPNILLEPSGKNTAPAIALAAFEALKKDNDSILLVLPADHIINGKAQFQETIKQSLELAINGNLVTFGIIPV